MQIRLFVFAVGLLFAGFTFELVRRKVLRPEHALIWAAMSLATFLLALFPNAVALLGRVTGMTYQSTIIVVLFIFVGLVFLNYSVIISRHGGRIIRLTQEVGLLRERLDKLSNQPENHS